jgi:hypothetical protein
MTPADRYPARLDPAHVLGICTRAAGTVAGIQAVGIPDGVRVSLPNRQSAWSATAALGRVGYTAALTGRTRGSRDLVVTGWNAERLESRLTAMRLVMRRLQDNPLVTATAAVRRFAALPRAEASLPAAADILSDTRWQLQDWVEARAGICMPGPPAVLPADTANALRVRAMAGCEQVVSDLVERHLRVAAHALTLFDSLRPQMNNGRAQNTAVRRAGATFHLSSGSVAQDSSPLMRHAAAGPAPAAADQADPPAHTRSGPRRGMAQEFPARPGVTGPADTTPPAGRVSPGGQHFPAARPGPHR